MEVQRVLRMVEGTGDNSYANNSSIQKQGSLQMKHLIHEAVLDLYSEGLTDATISIADLGCSSGPNTFWIVSEIINIIDGRRHLLGHRSSPQYLIYLNDLESNDFNTVFKTLLPPFYEKIRIEKGEEFGPCFVAAMPGSFYGRLFPSKSLNFVHSAHSVHWLSQVPVGLEDEMGNPLNKGHVYLGDRSPDSVFEAYLKQFKKDFSSFLRLRAEEIVGGGRMVLILIGRRSGGKENFYVWSAITKAIQEAVSKGFIEESKLDTLNFPIYHPSIEDLTEVIAGEGSFDLNKIESFGVDLLGIGKEDDEGCDLLDKARAEMLVKTNRAVIGPILAAHFGEDATNEVFKKLGQVPRKYWKKDENNVLHIGLSLTRKKHGE